MNAQDRQLEADRLTKHTKRRVEYRRVICGCDFYVYCQKCAGDGEYYIPSYKFCGHSVDGGGDDCLDNNCAALEANETERTAA